MKDIIKEYKDKEDLKVGEGEEIDEETYKLVTDEKRIALSLP